MRVWEGRLIVAFERAGGPGRWIYRKFTVSMTMLRVLRVHRGLVGCLRQCFKVGR